MAVEKITRWRCDGKGCGQNGEIHDWENAANTPLMEMRVRVIRGGGNDHEFGRAWLCHSCRDKLHAAITSATETVIDEIPF